IVFRRPEVQSDVGASRLLPDDYNGIVPFARTLPSDALVGRDSSAATEEDNPLRDDEARVEADAELTDELGVLGGLGGQALKALARPGLGDRADLVDDFLPRETDAVV